MGRATAWSTRTSKSKMSRLVFSQGSFWASDSALGVLQAPSIRLRASAETTGTENFMPSNTKGWIKYRYRCDLVNREYRDSCHAVQGVPNFIPCGGLPLPPDAKPH